MRSAFIFACALCASILIPSRASAQIWWRGADASTIPQIESEGGIFRNHLGTQVDPIALFASKGMNIVRLHVFVNPSDTWCDQPHTYAMAKRIVAAGMQFCVDFHFSDSYANASTQTQPAAWQGMTHAQLVAQVQSYTFNFVSGLVAQGTPPYAVQLGNEISHGMLWPDGQLKTPVATSTAAQWKSLGELLKAGVNGARAGASPNQVFIVIHTDYSNDTTSATTFYNQVITTQGVGADYISLSYYPWKQGAPENLEAAVNALLSLKPVIVGETEYPWTYGLIGNWPRIVTKPFQVDPRFNGTRPGQASYVESLISFMWSKWNPNTGLGTAGVMYEAPESIDDPVNHSSTDNLAFFDFQGIALPALDALGNRFTFLTDRQEVSFLRKPHLTIAIPQPAKLSTSTIYLVSFSPTLGIPLIIVPTSVVLQPGQTVAYVVGQPVAFPTPLLPVFSVQPNYIFAIYGGTVQFIAFEVSPSGTNGG